MNIWPFFKHYLTILDTKKEITLHECKAISKKEMCGFGLYNIG